MKESFLWSFLLIKGKKCGEKNECKEKDKKRNKKVKKTEEETHKEEEIRGFPMVSFFS